MKNSVLVVLAVIAALCLCTGSAQAAFNKDYVPSCLDSIEPEIACFGSGLTLSPDATQTQKDCAAAINTAVNSCATQEMSGLRTCSRIQDPISQATCIDYNSDTARGCYDFAYSLCDPYAP